MHWILQNLWSLLAYAAVFTLSVIPVPEVPELEQVPIFDKWVHFVMYGGICCCVWYDLLADSIGVFIALPIGVFIIRPWAYKFHNRRV